MVKNYKNETNYISLGNTYLIRQILSNIIIKFSPCQGCFSRIHKPPETLLPGSY